MVPDVPDALAHRTDTDRSLTVGARQGRERLDGDRGDEQPGVADEVDRVRSGRARPRDQDPRQRRSDDPGGLPKHLVERDGRGHQLDTDQSRRRGLSRRAVDRAEAPGEEVRHVQQQERGMHIDRDATQTPGHTVDANRASEDAPYCNAAPTASSSTSRPSSSRGSSIVSGGSNRTTLPYVPAVNTITPRSSASRAIRFIVSATSGSSVSGASTSSIAHIAPRPRTSPTCGCRSSSARSRAIIVSPTTFARSRSASRSIRSSTASAAAAATGFPPYVPPSPPTCPASIRPARPLMALIGSPPPSDFALVTMSGRTSSLSIANQ